MDHCQDVFNGSTKGTLTKNMIRSCLRPFIMTPEMSSIKINPSYRAHTTKNHQFERIS